MDIRDLRKCIKYWQRMLGLSHWKIKAKLIEGLHNHSEESLDGTCNWMPEYRTATIEIRAEMADDKVVSTVVHELCHLLLEGHKTPGISVYDPCYEFGLNALSEAIFTLNAKAQSIRKRR